MNPRPRRTLARFLSLAPLALPLSALAGPAAPRPSDAPAAATKAAADDPAALYEQGLQYLNGKGVAIDEPRAFDLFQRAAAHGHGEALGSLGYFYSVGKVVEKDDAKARHYFERAAETGAAVAQINLGRFLLAGRGGARDPERGVALIEKAAAGGSQTARLLLGDIFYWGEHTNGTPDYPRAFAALQSLAEAGHAEAQNSIGVMLKDGRIPGRAPESGREWLLKAAHQQHAKACANLGLWGVDSPDRAVRIDALKWLLVARQLKELTAEYYLADYRELIKPDEMAAAIPAAEAVMQSFAAKK